MVHIQNSSATQSALTVPEVRLFPNAPNPFLEMTLLRFELPEEGEVSLVVLDSHGHLITSRSDFFEKGENHIVLKRADIREPGIYLYRLHTEFGTVSRRLVMY